MSGIQSIKELFLKRKRFVVSLVAAAAVIYISLAVFLPRMQNGAGNSGTVVIRVDDIQDYGFRDAQIFLMQESIVARVPLSLAVIPGMLGDDKEVVQNVHLSVEMGSEVAVHGWEHEDISRLSCTEQEEMLSRSRERIREILGCDTTVLVPPMFSFSEDTLKAMQGESFGIVSTMSDLAEPGKLSGIISLPATVELSDYANGTWTMKSPEKVKAETAASLKKYGYAVIVTHPQEFMQGDQLDQHAAESYRELLSLLKENYTFTTLEELGRMWRQP